VLIPIFFLIVTISVLFLLIDTQIEASPGLEREAPSQYI